MTRENQCGADDLECSDGDSSISEDVAHGVKIAKGSNNFKQIRFFNLKNIQQGSNPEGRPPEVSLANCYDRHEECIQFESQGECENNPGWMIVNCPKSCNACHLRDPKVRCQR